MVDNRKKSKSASHTMTGKTSSVLQQNGLGKIESMNRDSSSLHLLNSLGSRGSIMLKAALSESGKAANVPPKHFVEQKTKTQEVLHKRLPRTKVLFSEPVVTQHYEYEQTFLPNLEQDQQVVSFSNQDSERIITARKNFSRRKIRPIDAYDSLDDIKVSGFAAIDTDNDDDDEIFTIASTELSDDNIQPKHTAQKRPYEAINSSDDSRPHYDRDFNSGPSENEGLFSSPKVAKIAPFYHDQPLKQPTDLEGLQNQAHNLPNHTRFQRISLHKLAILSGVRSTDLKQSETSDFKIQRSMPELLSVRDIATDPSDPTVQSDPSSSNTFSYFGWLSNGFNYLSNRMNKLIF